MFEQTLSELCIAVKKGLPAELVIEGSSDDRRVEIVAWHLNGLRARHRLPDLAALDPNAYRRLLEMDLIELDEGLLRFDVESARETIDMRSRRTGTRACTLASESWSATGRI